MRLLHIDHLADCSPFALSGGQQRLVAIAGVLACRPKLIIMDEPAAGLDADARRRLHALIGRLHERGVAVMLITHDTDEARAVADRIVRIAPAAGADERDVASRGENATTSTRDGTAHGHRPGHSERRQSKDRVSASFVARLDPRVKLPVFLLVMMCAFVISNGHQLAVGACAVAMVLAASRIGVRRLWRSMSLDMALWSPER